MKIKFDSASDVLYIQLVKKYAICDEEEDWPGVLWRRDDTETIVGVTILRFVSNWLCRLDLLSSHLTEGLGIELDLKEWWTSREVPVDARDLDERVIQGLVERKEWD